jgi:pimeloyl-ACP methyl ester carboxylesterase
MWTSYALASGHSGTVVRLAVAEATIPGMAASPPLLGPKPLNDFLWHFSFNRAGDIAAKLVEGREELYFGYQFASKAGSADALPKEVVRVYVDALKQPGALQASFAFYAAIDENMRQIADRKKRPLNMPVLALGGSRACNDRVAADMQIAATDVTSVIISSCGHFMAEEAPGEMITALQAFFKPYREDGR